MLMQIINLVQVLETLQNWERNALNEIHMGIVHSLQTFVKYKKNTNTEVTFNSDL
jgi:hypothetical protein